MRRAEAGAVIKRLGKAEVRLVVAHSEEKPPGRRQWRLAPLALLDADAPTG